MNNESKKKWTDRFKEWKDHIISFNWIDVLYEKVMQGDQSIKGLAFIIVLFIYVLTQYISPFSFTYAEDVRGKALTVIYDTEKYVVEGLPKTVDFTLEGKEAVVRTLVNNNTFNALVDLSQLKPGQHIVNIDYDVIPSQVKVTSNPKNVSVLIKELKQIEKNIQLEYYNGDLKDPLIELGVPHVSQKVAVVKGAKDKVEQVVSVKGMVDISDPSKLKEIKVDLFAVDKQGNKLDVTLEPSQVEVSIDSSIPQKEVLLDLRFEDDFPKGKLLKSTQIMPSKVLVYGPSDKLEALNVLFLNLKASNIYESGIYQVEVPMPEGVSKLETTTVDVKVDIEDEVSKVIKDIPVQVSGIKEGLTLANKVTTTITIKGLKDVVDEVDASQFKLWVDASELGIGEHEVALQLDKTIQNIKVDKPEFLKIKITK